MGVGAAAIMPTTLSVITTSFPVEDRPKAIGVWVGVAGGGAVLGLFGSGILLEFFSWSSFFGLNVVLAAIALVGTLLVVPTSVDANPPRLDLVGAVLSLVAVVGDRVRDHRGPRSRLGRPPDRRPVWSPGSLALVAFVLWELRVDTADARPAAVPQRAASAPER